MKPLQLGILGIADHYGRRMHKPIMESALVSPCAIGSRDITRAQSAAQKWQFAKAYGSYQEVVDDPDVEAVYIPLPNNLHAEWIKKCADARKAVLCEKPLAMSADEAADALEYADKKGILVMEAFMYKFHPQWSIARDIIEAGEIGDIMSIHTVFSFFNDDPNNIRNQQQLGGGALYDIGCYAISSARLLMGREPEKLISDVIVDPQLNIDTMASAIVNFGGPRLQFTVSTRMNRRQKVSVYGSKGNLTILRPFNAYPDIPLAVIVDDGDTKREIRCEIRDQYKLMLTAFIEAYRNGLPSPILPSDSIANMKVIDAVFRSGKSGQWESL